MLSHKRYRWNIYGIQMFHTSMSFTVIVPRLQRHCYWWAILQAMAVDSFLLGRKCDPALLLFPSRICPDFIARPYHGICALFVVSAPGKLCIQIERTSLPTDVPPALIQTTVTRTFAKPAVNLSRLNQRKGCVQMQRMQIQKRRTCRLSFLLILKSSYGI